eukprot:CAMPEP_0184644368 /NCGR_PEP_ID=MMETSP0308-20130426/1092_1 /TAXON_ID=38269 /ORGANISM="Gloeochaete witrockiana, Strain SAG 46.84" /LENGTH=369 /DNA_ID=CAMNT_0027072853 /DNA_START=1468 /DNA_END=2577 /DNA_ORIENTATION=-
MGEAKSTKWSYFSKSPLIFYQNDEMIEEIFKRCPILSENYRPSPFLYNGHLQTIFAALFRRNPDVQYDREYVPTSDGGEIALDYLQTSTLPADAPILILLHGLTGGSHDAYIKYMVLDAHKAGFRPIAFNSRGCAGVSLKTPQFYSASFTGDIRTAIIHIHHRFPQASLTAVGWSLGANILLRYVGEEGDKCLLAAAVSLANPFDLTISSAMFERFWQRNIYDKRLASNMFTMLSQHAHLFTANTEKGYEIEKALQSRTVREFDDAITRKTFGWDSVDAYYAGSSSSLSIPLIRIPTLCINALDDPIAPKEAIPYAACKENKRVILATTTYGGHCAWCEGLDPFGASVWVDSAVVQFCRAAIDLDNGHL